MKKGKILSSILALATLCGVLTGCGATTESVLDKSAKKLEKIDSQSLTVTADFGIKVDGGESGTSMEMGVNVNGDVKVKKSSDTDFITSFTGRTSINAFGVSQDVDMELYVDSSKNDDEITTKTYTKTSDSDEWKLQTNTVKAENTTSEVAIFDSLLKNKLSLQKDTVEVDGINCFNLTGTITGTDIYEVIKNTGLLNDEKAKKALESVNTSAFETAKADVIYLVNKKTYLPKKLEVDFSKTDINSALKSGLEAVGVSAEDINVSFSVAKVTVKFNEFGKFDVKIPEDALNAVETAPVINELETSVDEDSSNVDIDVDSDVDLDSDSNSDLNEKPDEELDVEMMEYIDDSYPRVTEDNIFDIQTYDLDRESDDSDVIVMLVSNKTDDEVLGSGAIRYYDAEGTLVGADALSTYSIKPHGTDICEIFTDIDYASYEIALVSDTLYGKAVYADAEYLGKKDGLETFNITNKGTTVSYNQFIVLFFNGDELVDYQYAYREDGDYYTDFEKGASAKYVARSEYNYDRCEIVLTGSAEE